MKQTENEKIKALIKKHVAQIEALGLTDQFIEQYAPVISTIQQAFDRMVKEQDYEGMEQLIKIFAELASLTGAQMGVNATALLTMQSKVGWS
jgi:hypothetical protein